MSVHLNNLIDGIEYTVLLLSENGAGKSTLINALANYLKFASFDQVKPQLLKQLIPSKFKWLDPETLIKSGNDENEVCTLNSMSTTTQQPRCYTFCSENRTIRFIDTPGMIHPEKICEKVVRYFRNLTKAHGICFVIKSDDDAQKLINLKYVISEVLTILHNDARMNITFCFTHSRNLSFGPNDNFTSLKYFLESFEIQLNENENCFFVDNEAFHYFIAQRFDYSLPDEQIQQIRKSWNQSAFAMQKMVDYFAHQLTYQVNLSKLLFQARNALFQLEEPIQLSFQALRRLEQNSEQIDQTLKNAIEDKNELAKNLGTEIYYLEICILTYPCLVCLSDKCIGFTKNNLGQRVKFYKTRCHEHVLACILIILLVNQDTIQMPDLSGHRHFSIYTFVHINNFLLLGHQAIKDCIAIKNGKCTYCGCAWQTHMHMTRKCEKIKRKQIEKNKQLELLNCEDVIHKLKNKSFLKRNLLQNHQHMHTELINICSKLSFVINKNSIMKINEFAKEKQFFNLLGNSFPLPSEIEDIPKIIESLSNFKQSKHIYESINVPDLNNGVKLVVILIKLDTERLHLKIDCLNNLTSTNNQNVTAQHKAILSELIESKALIVESDGKVNLKGATLENVIFASGKSSINTGNVNFNQTSFDTWIKANFLELYPLIKDAIPIEIQIKEIVEHEVERKNFHEEYQKATQIVENQFNNIRKIANIETERKEGKAQKTTQSAENLFSSSVDLTRPVLFKRNPDLLKILCKIDQKNVEAQKTIQSADNPLSSSVGFTKPVPSQRNTILPKILFETDRKESDNQISIQSDDNLNETTIKRELDSREMNDESQKFIQFFYDKMYNSEVITEPPVRWSLPFSKKILALFFGIVSVVVLIVIFLV